MLLLGFATLRLSSCLLCGAAGTDDGSCSACAIYTQLPDACPSTHFQQGSVEPTREAISGKERAGVENTKSSILYLCCYNSPGAGKESRSWECLCLPRVGVLGLLQAPPEQQPASEIPDVDTPDRPNQAMCAWEKLECHTWAPPELQFTSGSCLVRLVTS